MSARGERIVFIIAAASVFVFVLLRALLVPLVHDEATSFLAYAQSGRFLPFASLWDANNHYLNSLLGFIGFKLFGLKLLALRYGSVLSYLLFAWSAWRLGQHVQYRTVRCILWSALLFCPFLLDFFSLFRGYGPAMAFLLFSLQALMRFAQGHRHGDLLAVLLGTAVANGFLLALVPLWAVMLLLLTVLAWKERRSLLLIGIAGWLPLAGAAGLSLLLSRLGLLYHGSTSGFMDVTVGTLAWRVFGLDGSWVRAVMVSMVGAAGLLLVLPFARSGEKRASGIVILGLLLLEAGCRIAAAHTMHLNYAEDRTALHSLLLAILLTGLAADRLAARWRYGWLLAAPLLMLPLRALRTGDLESTVLWPEQSIPGRFVDRVATLEKELGRQAVVGTHRHAGHPWALQRRMHGSEGDANAHSWPNGMDDARIAMHRDLAAARAGFRVVDSAPRNQLYLLLRETPLRLEMISDTAFALSLDATERSSMMELPVQRLRSQDLLVQVSAELESSSVVIDPRMVIDILDTSGAIIHSDIVFLSTRRAQWQGERWQCIRHVPVRAAAASAVLYYWEPEARRCTFSNGRMLVQGVVP